MKFIGKFDPASLSHFSVQSSPTCLLYAWKLGNDQSDLVFTFRHFNLTLHNHPVPLCLPLPLHHIYPHLHPNPHPCAKFQPFGVIALYTRNRTHAHMHACNHLRALALAHVHQQKTIQCWRPYFNISCSTVIFLNNFYIFLIEVLKIVSFQICDVMQFMKTWDHDSKCFDCFILSGNYSSKKEILKRAILVL